ncbi:hypothetical protein OG613_39940 [Streptomyces sp. NBC_00015]|uniref:hypothetical protein n=1 Tax=unclassified Streptomyces TaxID=2593676 RepID=UPI002259E233|nr:hypothetical protein [Streptomyces sp. NBC_00103]MCX5373512.1 hypothetical protein [Streptomyces sp. NBC_00103]
MSGILSGTDLMPDQAAAPDPYEEIAVATTRRTVGVADVVDRLTCRWDDAALRAEARAPHGAADDRPGRL